MMRWLVAASLEARYVVLAAALALVAWGAMQFDRMPVDALPEFTAPLVEVQTEATGLSAEEVESLITIGLEDLLSGVPWLESTRSSSVTGLSTITLVFKRGTDIIRARQMVQERLVLDYKLPNVATPPVILQPVSTTNRFMMVGLSSEKIEPTELSLLARWTVKPRLMGVPGVANVSIWGQRLRQLAVQFHPERLRDARVIQDDIIAAAGDAMWVSPLTFLKSSAASPGGWFDNPAQRIGVEHLMPIDTPEDMAKVTVTPEPEMRLGRALPLGEVADLTFTHAPVIGDASIDGTDGLLLVIEKFPSTSVDDVTRGIDQAVAELSRGLPGVKIDAKVFRLASYVEASTRNVSLAALAGIALAFLVALLLMRSWKRALIVAVTTIVALSAAVAVLAMTAATVNALMLAGLAAALAVAADSAVAHAERLAGALRHRRADADARGTGEAVAAGPRDADGSASLVDAIRTGGRSLAVPVLIGLMAIVPILALRGNAGAFLEPYAIAYALAIAAALLAALTVAPAMAGVLLERGGPASDVAVREPMLPLAPVARLSDRALAKPTATLAIAAAVAIAGLAVWTVFGQSRVPPLDGTMLVVDWSTAPGTSQAETQRITARAARELKQIPGVRSVATHIGRAVTGDRIVGINDAQLWVTLEPGFGRRDAYDRVVETLAGYPGIRQSVQGYLDQRAEGIAAVADERVVVRVYGPRREVRLQKAEEIRRAIADVPGIVEPRIDGEAEEPQIQVKVNLDAASRADVKPGDVRRASATVFAGLVVGYLFKEQKIFEVVVWGAPEARASLANLRDVWIDKADRTRVRLSDVADVSFEATPTVIRHERIAAFIDVVAGVSGARISDVRSTIGERLQAIQFPVEHRPEIVGEATDRARDRTRTLGIGIGSIIAIFLLLQAGLRSWGLAASAFVMLLPALGASVLVGAIAGGFTLASVLGLPVVIGIGARHAMTVLERMESPDADRAGWRAATMRSLAVSTAVVVAAMLPMIVLVGLPGFELIRPMAIVVVAGAIASMLSAMVLLPLLHARWRPAAGTLPDDGLSGRA